MTHYQILQILCLSVSIIAALIYIIKQRLDKTFTLKTTMNGLSIIVIGLISPIPLSMVYVLSINT